MSDQDFDLKLKHIEEQYAARKEGAEAYRDQEVARLFEQCGWRQERIAAHMGKKQPWVAKRLCFGRFLVFIPSGNNSQIDGLTERRFREHYKAACLKHPGKHQSRDKEERRFAHVLDAITHGVPQGKDAIGKHMGIGPAVRSLLKGGWHTVDDLLLAVGETVPGVTLTQIHGVITRFRSTGRLDVKRQGKIARYRWAERRQTPARSVDPAELYERVRPLIDELDALGRMHELCMSPVAVRMVAAKLRRLLEPARVAETV